MTFRWIRDFEYFFKKNERKGYLVLFGINILLIILLFYLAFAEIPEKPNLTNTYLVIIGALITLLTTILFEYSRDLARRKDLLWPYLEVLDDLNDIVISIILAVQRVFPLNSDLIRDDQLNAQNFSKLISLLKGLTEDQIHKNLNRSNLTEFCKHINMPYETLGRLYPMFLTIADLYSKEFISLTSGLYKNLQDMKRFCSYNTSDMTLEADKKKDIKFINILIHLLETIGDLNSMIKSKLVRYEKYKSSSK